AGRTGRPATAGPGRRLGRVGGARPPDRHSSTSRIVDRPAQSRSPLSKRTTRRSVTTAVTSDDGVTSNAGLTASAPEGAQPYDSTSAAPRSSISTADPDGVSMSTVDSGATTTNG